MLDFALNHTQISFDKAALQARIQGTVVVPGDADYDQARQSWNLSAQHQPAVIVIANNANDVIEAVQFAKLENLGITMQGTGHGVARPADAQSLLIVTSNMNNVRIDAQQQTAWVEAGAKWGAVLEPAQAVGLAPLLGSSSTVGVMGYTLGGGMGWLARKYGLSLDSVRFFEVVTAEGHLVYASKTENPDLFWALRGGGGNFGVITGMEIQLYPVTTVYGGKLIYPIQYAKAVFQHYREWIKTAPDELTSSVSIMNFPPMPAVPEFLRGQTVVMVSGLYAGAVEEGAALVQPWLEWMSPMANTFGTMPFSEVDTVSGDPKDPMPGLSSGAWLRNLDDTTIDLPIQYALASNGSPLVKAEVRHAGGAIARVDKNANAYGHRSEQLIMQVVAVTPFPEALHAAEAHIAAMKQALAASLTGGVYLNFLDGQEARDCTQAGYLPESYHWLSMLKEKYDPENRFRYSFNIPAKQ